MIILTHKNPLLISDLHLRNPNLSDDHFNACMDAMCPATHDTLILVGDCIDRTRSSRPDRREAEFLARCKRFKTWIVILGNHEWRYYSAAGLYHDAGADKVCMKYRFYSGGKLFIVEHGHRFDKNCNGENALYWNRALVRTTTFFDKLFKCDVQEWLRRKRWIDKALRDVENDEGIMKRALKKYAFADCWVITGHRHAPFIDYGQRYCDCGDFVQHKTYVAIKDGKIKLRGEK